MQLIYLVILLTLLYLAAFVLYVRWIVGAPVAPDDYDILPDDTEEESK